MLDDEAPRSELIAKLIRAGYLRPERQHDPDAVAGVIARIKEDLRSGGSGGRRQVQLTSLDGLRMIPLSCLI